ncbi:TDE2712 family protein [Bacillus benzoevorans]|uniref:Uncharacterized protein n=1 Tax=Bacillus benzoevorans TaxID=1456 RepID=A0A7X0LWJ5_9BACI|nr:hypothetical protein [Bacillus benzoevorans]MBB6445572.1 hypothetical protein [Bacillus benzoevorans]
MVQRIKLNLEEIESMLYFWQASNDKEKVAESFLHEVAAMKGITASYDDEFNAESVRKVLSAITNREILSQKTQKEARFWNNNMWMMEDLSYTDTMVKPLKLLNIDDMAEDVKNAEGSSRYEELEVRFSPLHMDEYIIKGNRLIINFFRVMPSAEDGESATIGGKQIKEFIKEKLEELLKK